MDNNNIKNESQTQTAHTQNENGSDKPTENTVRVEIVKQSKPGFTVGVIASIMGVLSILTFGIIFVPLTFVLAVIGLIVSVPKKSWPGVGMNVFALFLGILGIVSSPTLWVILASWFS